SLLVALRGRSGGRSPQDCGDPVVRVVERRKAAAQFLFGEHPLARHRPYPMAELLDRPLESAIAAGRAGGLSMLALPVARDLLPRTLELLLELLPGFFQLQLGLP